VTEHRGPHGPDDDAGRSYHELGRQECLEGLARVRCEAATSASRQAPVEAALLYLENRSWADEGGGFADDCACLIHELYRLLATTRAETLEDLLVWMRCLMYFDRHRGCEPAQVEDIEGAIKLAMLRDPERMIEGTGKGSAGRT